MKGLIRPSRTKPKTIKLRMTVQGIPVGAMADVTDLMLQPGSSVSGWLPHVTELPWSSGLTYLNTAPTGEIVFWDEIQGKPVVFPPESHTHLITEVDGLQAALDSKQASGDYASNSDLSSGLASKANTSHTHTVANVTGLQTALDGKAPTSHTHANATQSQPGLMSAQDKTKLDGTDLGYRKKFAIDKPSTYPGGVSAGLVSRSDGWPADTSFWTLVNMGSSSFVAAKVQHLYPYNAPGVAPLFRVALSDDSWAPFSPLRG